MNGGTRTARVIPAGSAHPWIIGLFSAALALVPAAVRAQAVDCSALRARIEAGREANGTGRIDASVQRTRAELERVRAYADDSGCNGGSLFDDADSPECHALLQRAEQLRQTVERLAAEGASGGGDADRRAAIEDYNAFCTGGGTDAALPPPDAVVPVDPDASGGPAPAPVPADRVARVYCVRHCDGAYYPLAVDVGKDRLAGLDQLCQAQCPNAEASAYSASDGDLAKAEAADGTTYAALPAAFAFQKTASPTCACRAPGESWAETLSKAETMIEAHKGDVVVTPEVQARMEVPQPVPDAKPAAAKPKPPKTTSKRSKVPSPGTPPPVDAETADPGRDLTRAFRQAAPTL